MSILSNALRLLVEIPADEAEEPSVEAEDSTTPENPRAEEEQTPAAEVEPDPDEPVTVPEAEVPGGEEPDTEDGGPEDAPELAEEAPEVPEESEPVDEVAELRALLSRRSEALLRERIATTGMLADPADFAYAEDLVDAEEEVLRAALEEYLEAHPHHARIRVSGDVGQGPKDEPAAVSLLSLLKQ